MAHLDDLVILLSVLSLQLLRHLVKLDDGLVQLLKHLVCLLLVLDFCRLVADDVLLELFDQLSKLGFEVLVVLGDVLTVLFELVPLLPE